jgi:hypothetical protein
MTDDTIKAPGAVFAARQCYRLTCNRVTGPEANDPATLRSGRRPAMADNPFRPLP